MSRRGKRRQKAGRGGGIIGKWLFRIVSILAVVSILAGFGVYSWLKSYLHSDEFRVFMGETLSESMGADAQFELFEWQGMRARTGGFSAKNGGVIREMRVDGIQATLGLGGVRRGVWEVSDVRISQLDVVMDTGAESDPAGGDDEGVVVDDSPVKADVESGFLAGLLPDRAEVSSVEITSANVRLKTSGGGVIAKDVSMKIENEEAKGVYDVWLSGGVIDVPWLGSPINLTTARGRYRDGRVFLTESRSQVYERGLLTLKGEVDGDRFAFYGVLRDVRSEEIVPEDWQKRITGDLTAKVKVKSGERGILTQGELELKKGVLTALPVLDRIAAYANTRRFRRLNLSEASLKFRREGGRLDLTDIVLASEGLVRVVGRLSVVDGRLDGRFRVGVMPGTLAHIPGAETKVFIRGEKGLLWSPLRITGTVDDPKEDLSNRMIVAAGERMFELVPETGRMALKFAHDTLTNLPEAAVDTVDEVIGGGQGGVIGEGADVIREGAGGILDLIPGSKREDDE